MNIWESNQSLRHLQEFKCPDFKSGREREYAHSYGKKTNKIAELLMKTNEEL